MSSIHLARRGYINAGVPGTLERLRNVDNTTSTFLVTGSGTASASNNYTFIDSSANNVTVTRNGDTVQCGFSPFGTAYPGSMYFDGTGDYLTVPDSTNYMWNANQDFTIECWVYLTATPGAQGGHIWGRQEYGTNSNFVFQISSTRQLAIYINNGAPTYDFRTVATLNLNQWYHVAFVRSGTSTNNNTFYINGVGSGSFTLTTDSSGGSSGVWTVGADQAGDESRFTGFISNLRYVKGTAVYTGNFTPATSPLTAVTNTQLLIKGDNIVGITDVSQFGFPLLAGGNANLSTTQKKFGPTSMSFDGTGDGVTARLSQSATAFNFGTGPFTMEAWVYNTNYNASQGSTIIGAHEYGSATNFLFGLDTTGKLRFTDGTTTVTAASALTQNAWVHVAVTRTVNGLVTLYQNGTSVGSGTITASIANSGYNVTIGADSATDEATFTGYIADVRVCKIAVYTDSFTSPTTTSTVTTSGFGVVSNSVYGVYQLA
jgi:hypothetical protein